MQLGELIEASVPEVAALPVSVHAALVNEYAELQARTKRIGATLDAALEMAYGKRNAPGTARQVREGFEIKSSAQKKVDWDADKLKRLVETDSDASEYIEWVPKVSETAWKGAPDRIKKLLEPARTEKAQKTNFEIAEKEY